MSNTIMFEFSARDSFSQKVKTINNNMRLLSNEIKQAENSMKSSSDKLEGLGKKYEALGKAVEQQKNKIKTYNEEIKKNNESIEKNKQKLTDLAKKKEELSKQIDIAKKQYGEESKEVKKLQEELDKCNQQYRNTEASIASAEGKIQSYTTQVSNCETEISRLEAEMRACNEQIQEQSNKFLQASETLVKTGDKLQAIGGKISDVSEKFMAVGTAVLGVTGTLGKQAMEWESSVAKVNAIAKLTGDELVNYSNKMMEASNNTGQASSDIANSVYDAISSGIAVADAVDFVAQMNTLATAGFADLGQAIDLVTTVINAYGLEASDATDISDKLIKTQDLGKITVAEMASSMGKIIPTANSASVGLDQLCTGYAVMTSQGVKAAESTTYMNSMLNELSDSGSTVGKTLKEQTGKSFKELMESGTNLSDVMVILNKEAEKQGLQFGELWGSAEAGKAGLALLTDEGKKFNTTLEKMQNATGSTQEAFDILSETTEYKMNKSINQLKNSFISLGEGAVPMIEKLAEWIGNLAKFLGELDPKIVTTAMEFGAWTLGIGAVGTALGKTVTGVGKFMSVLGGLAKLLSSGVTSTTTLATGIAGVGTSTMSTVGALGTMTGALAPLALAIAGVGAVVYSLHEYNDMLGKSITTSREEMSWMERTLADLTGTMTYSKEELQQMGIIYEDFNENISPEFQQAVESMRDSIHNFNMDLAIFSADGIFGEEEIEELKNNFNTGVDASLESIRGRKEEVQNSWQETFIVDDGILDENEQTIIQYYNRQYDTAIEEVEKMKADVNEIFRKVVEEGYVLTPEDEQTIREYFARINEIELECLAGNEEEQLFAKNKFLSQIEKADADSAVKIGKQRKAQLEEELTDTEAYYDTKMQMLEKDIENTSGAEREAFLYELEQLKSEKEQKVQAKKDEINAIYDEIISGNENLKGEIDRFNLELFEGDDKKFNDRLNKLKQSNADMLTEEKTGMKQRYDAEKECWVQTTTLVDESTGEITGIIETWVDENGMHLETAEGYNADYKASTSEMAENMVVDYNRMKIKLQEYGGVTVDTSGQIINANGQVIGSIDQVIDENGDLITSVKDVNNNPIDIGDNTADVITGLQNTYNQVNNLNGKKATVTVETVQKTIFKTEYQNTTLPKLNFKPSYSATGTESSNEGLYVVNEPSAGWELINQPSGIQAYALSSLSDVGDYTYLEAGTQVMNHLASVESMRRDIKAEVARQLGSGGISKTDIDRIIKAIENSGTDVNITNDIDINNSSNVDMDKTNKGMEQLFKEQLRKYGKIKK